MTRSNQLGTRPTFGWTRIVKRSNVLGVTRRPRGSLRAIRVKHRAGSRISSHVRFFGRALMLRKVIFASSAALADRRVPGRLKLLAVGAVLLILSPLNILGDIPLLGIVDDAGLLALALMWFTRSAAPYQQTIDAPASVIRAK